MCEYRICGPERLVRFEIYNVNGTRNQWNEHHNQNNARETSTKVKGEYDEWRRGRAHIQNRQMENGEYSKRAIKLVAV